MFNNDWQYKRFIGSKWSDVKDPTDQNYLKNTYRVLLTRARQGMVIFIPEGSINDVTRQPLIYDEIYNYFKCICSWQRSTNR